MMFVGSKTFRIHPWQVAQLSIQLSIDAALCDIGAVGPNFRRDLAAAAHSHWFSSPRRPSKSLWAALMLGVWASHVDVLFVDKVTLPASTWCWPIDPLNPKPKHPKPQTLNLDPALTAGRHALRRGRRKLMVAIN